jgi:hypothetical protein
MENQAPEQEPNPFTPLPEDLLTKILSNLSHRDLVSAAKVDRQFAGAAPNTNVEGSATPLRCLNAVMEGHKLLGYHGTLAKNAESMYHGIDASKFGQNWATSELGPGLYTVPVPRSPNTPSSTDKKLAQMMATGWAPSGSPTVALPVLARGLVESDIYKMKVGDPIYSPSHVAHPNLAPLPYVTSHNAVEDLPTSTGLPPKQLKLNPQALDGSQANHLSIQVAPPAGPDGKLDPDFLLAMLMKYSQQNPDDPLFE